MTLAPGMRDPDSNADRRTRVSEQLRRRAQTARFLAASRRREFVTVRRFAPNSFLEAHITRFQHDGAGQKHLLKISLVLPLVATSATAYAGSTISDKSYWPSEARQSAQNRTGSSQSDLNFAFAYDRAASPLQPVTITSDRSASRYHGGPKSPW